MSDADHRESLDQDAKYYLIFLHSIPERPLSREVVDLHAAHLAELDEGGKLVMAGPLLERAGGLIVLRTASAAEAMAIDDPDRPPPGRRPDRGLLRARGNAIPEAAVDGDPGRGRVVFQKPGAGRQGAPINRTFINTWQDQRVVEAVKKTGRKELLIAALWTEMCLAMPAIQAQGEGYDVYAVTDASGGVSVEAHDMAIRRMVQAGVRPVTWINVLASGSGIGRALKRWPRPPRFSLRTAAPPASPLPGRCSFSATRPGRLEYASA